MSSFAVPFFFAVARSCLQEEKRIFHINFSDLQHTNTHTISMQQLAQVIKSITKLLLRPPHNVVWGFTILYSHNSSRALPAFCRFCSLSPFSPTKHEKSRKLFACWVERARGEFATSIKKRKEKLSRKESNQKRTNDFSFFQFKNFFSPFCCPCAMNSLGGVTTAQVRVVKFSPTTKNHKLKLRTLVVSRRRKIARKKSSIKLSTKRRRKGRVDGVYRNRN